MFNVQRVADDGLNITVSGKMDADEAARMIAALFKDSAGIENGRMLIDVNDFHVPSLGAFKVEMARMPDLLRFSRQFSHATVLADEDWIRAMSNIESKLIPGLVIKSFRKDQRYHAETWLAQANRNEQVATKDTGGEQ